MLDTNGLSKDFRKLDDLLLHLKGLVLVREIRERRGAEESELLMYGAEIERVRTQLAQFVRSGEAERPSRSAGSPQASV
jgi:hypothetical protein